MSNIETERKRALHQVRDHERLVARQREIVAWLERSEHSSELAVNLLRGLEEPLALHRDYLAELQNSD